MQHATAPLGGQQHRELPGLVVLRGVVVPKIEPEHLRSRSPRLVRVATALERTRGGGGIPAAPRDQVPGRAQGPAGRCTQAPAAAQGRAAGRAPAT
jgi:hypothetical protein